MQTHTTGSYFHIIYYGIHKSESLDVLHQWKIKHLGRKILNKTPDYLQSTTEESWKWTVKSESCRKVQTNTKKLWLNWTDYITDRIAE